MLTEEEKWRAVVGRDMDMNGIFVFAVRSTGIYCHPSCPAKHSGRAQVQFFSSPEEAERSGFRPCRRCKPNENASTPQRVMVDQVRAFIEKNLDKKLTLSILSSQAGVSPYHLQRTFKRIVGVSPRKYVEALRLVKMRQSLLNGETVSRAIYRAGFSSRSRFYEAGSHKFGMTAGALRRGGEGTRISYTIVSSPLGRLLVGATEFGICAVCIGDSDVVVEQALSEQYPSAEVQRDDASLREWVTDIVRYLNGRKIELNVPLDIHGTAFQSRVWKEIRSVPYGSTTTYSRIADAMGRPEAVRAVARACATNPVALIIPCHRVIGVDGKMHGYRWGTQRKQHLLLLERATPT